MTRTRRARESRAARGRLPRRFAWVAGLALCAAGGCAKSVAPPASAPASAPVPQPEPEGPRPETYPSLCADPARREVVAAYLEAWDARCQAPGPLAQARRRLLGVYGDCYRALGKAREGHEYDRRLRVLWDLCGVAHATTIPPAAIKEAIGWRESYTPPELSGAEASLQQAAQRPVRARPEGLPSLCRMLLRAVPAEGVAEGSFADYVLAQSRQVYLTASLKEWSPASPLDVCGTSEPLTRTLILSPAGYVDLAPKPEWLVAAVAVHECAHLAWFHRPEVSRDPRLLLMVPNERNAFRVMARFLDGLTRVSDPKLRRHVAQHADPIGEQLAQAQQRVARANERLGLPADDRAEHLQLPAGIEETALRGQAQRPPP